MAFENRRAALNSALAFCALSLGEDGKLKRVEGAKTLTEAQRRAGRLRAELNRRKVHSEVLRFCRSELLQDNYFHAVFEATKGVAERIRQMSGLDSDGAELAQLAFSLGSSGYPTAHAPRVVWPIKEEDALDLLSLASLLHRRLDDAVVVPRG